MKMKMKMKSGVGMGLVMVVVLVMGRMVNVVGDEENLKQKCSSDIEKVVACMEFATGKAATPSKECCDTTKDIKDSKPECLCLIIQQTHNGSPQIKSLGIQEDKLLQLPSICHLKNSNISYCPKLLGLPPNSPDAAIFNKSATASPSSTTGTPAGPSPSSGIKIVPMFPAAPIALAVAAIFFFAAFPSSSSASRT